MAVGEPEIPVGLLDGLEDGELGHPGLGCRQVGVARGHAAPEPELSREREALRQLQDIVVGAVVGDGARRVPALGRKRRVVPGGRLRGHGARRGLAPAGRLQLRVVRARVGDDVGERERPRRGQLAGAGERAGEGRDGGGDERDVSMLSHGAPP